MTSPTNEPKTAEQFVMEYNLTFGRPLYCQCKKLEGGKVCEDCRLVNVVKLYAQQEGRELVEALKESRKLAALVWAGQATPADGDRFRYLMDNAIDKWEARNQ